MKPLTGSTTDQAPADPAATDDVLATQPIGYWSGLAHTAVTRHLRDAMARIDVTQPQYWVLNRVNGGPAAASREEVVTQLTPLADGPHEIARVVDQLLHRGWLRIISDAEYVAALRVLRTMIAHVEGDAGCQARAAEGRRRRPLVSWFGRCRQDTSVSLGSSPWVVLMSMTAKDAPCGSLSAAKRPNGLSIGPNRRMPPRSVAFATAASTSSTVK